MTLYSAYKSPMQRRGFPVNLDPPPQNPWPRYRCPDCGWLDMGLTADRTTLHCVACKANIPASMEELVRNFPWHLEAA